MDGGYGCRPRPDRGLALSALGNQTLIGLLAASVKRCHSIQSSGLRPLLRVPVKRGAFGTLTAA
jgi:hypothetical protein